MFCQHNLISGLGPICEDNKYLCLFLEQHLHLVANHSIHTQKVEVFWGTLYLQRICAAVVYTTSNSHVLLM